MKKEAHVKREVRKILDSFGKNIARSMYVPSGYGKQGIEDFTLCVYGWFVAIETKYGRGKLTPMQDRRMKEVLEAGGNYLIVTEKNVHRLKERLELYARRPR